MRRLLTSLCADRRRRGFSLLELLSALAVLSIIIMVLVQMAGMTSMTWLNVQKQVNNFAKARAMLDLLARDIQAGIFREDLAAFPNGTIAFYTTRPGVPSSSGSAPLRNISLVKYEINATSSDSVLSRGDLAINWNDPVGQISFGNTSDFPALDHVTMRDTAPGIVGFQVVFVQADGTMAPTFTMVSGTNPTRAIGIAVAVVDDSTIKRLTPEQVRTLQTALRTQTTGTQSPVADWDAYLNNNWNAYPKVLPTGLKMFERYVPLQ